MRLCEENSIKFYSLSFDIIIIKENSKQDSVLKIIMGFCETYEKLCQKKYPEAPLPLEILKSVN